MITKYRPYHSKINNKWEQKQKVLKLGFWLCFGSGRVEFNVVMSKLVQHWPSDDLYIFSIENY